MEKRKSAIIEALLTRVNIVADAHLKISSQEVPKIFRQGLDYVPNGRCSSAENDTETESEKKQQYNGELSMELDCAECVANSQGGEQDELRQIEVESLYASSSIGALNTKSPESNMETENKSDSQTPAYLEDLDFAYVEFMKWIPEDDPRALLIIVKHAVAHSNMGTALHSLQRLIDGDNPMSTIKSKIHLYTAIIELTTQLGWNHIANKFRNTVLIECPATYRLF